MDERTHTASTPPRDAANDTPPRAAGDSAAIKRRLSALGHGLCYTGIGYLLAGCALPLGTLPLGVALLCASSRYTWFILAGLAAGTLWGPFEGERWVWIGIYALAILLRLGILFFVEPLNLVSSTIGGTDGGSARQERRRMARQWAALKAILSDGQAHDPVQGSFSSSATSMDGINGTNGTGGTVSPRLGARGATPSSPRAVRWRLFNENPLLRVFTGAVCGFAAGLCGMIAGGFAFYDLFAALLTIVVVPVVTFLWIPCFRREGQALLFTPAATALTTLGTGREEKGNGLTLLPLLSVGGLLLAVVFGARDHVWILGTPYMSLRVAPLLAMLVTLAYVSRVGLPAGLAVAALAGLGASPLLAPAFILCALVYALLRFLSARMAVAGGCVAALFWCAVPGGLSGVSAHLFTFVLAIPLHLILEKLIPRAAVEGRFRTVMAEMRDFSDAAVREAREVAQNARLRALSEAFSSLSRLFYGMSDRLRHPRVADLHRACEGAVAEQCARCERRSACRTDGQDIPGALAAHLTVRLRTNATASVDAIPPACRAVCSHVAEIVEEVNARCGELTEQCVKSEKTEVFAADYKAMSAILAEAAAPRAGEEEDYLCDHAVAERIYARLIEAGIRIEGAVVCGKRERHVVVRGAGLEQLSPDKMANVKAIMEEECEIPLSSPIFDVRDGHTVMRLLAEPRLEVSFAGSTVPAGACEGEVLPAPLTGETAIDGYVPPYTCGDHIALFTSDRAYFYALISDGMGSGEEASLTSDICTVFLEKMLAAGNRPEIALSMLGSFIRQKNTGTGGECSATVDLMELDLFCGEAVFLKNGAAPTYVVRKGTVYKLRSRTMPIGILKDTPPDALRFRTHPGDVVVMVSDGVTHGNDECPWLIDLLSSPLPPSMDSLRLDILNHAIASGSPDDLSAIALRVGEKE